MLRWVYVCQYCFFRVRILILALAWLLFMMCHKSWTNQRERAKSSSFNFLHIVDWTMPSIYHLNVFVYRYIAPATRELRFSIDSDTDSVSLKTYNTLVFAHLIRIIYLYNAVMSSVNAAQENKSRIGFWGKQCLTRSHSMNVHCTMNMEQTISEPVCA